MTNVVDSTRVADETVLDVHDLRVGFRVDGGRLPAVDGVDLVLCRGETLAVVGESGSGKSALSMALLGLNRGPRTEISGTVHFDGEDLVTADESRLRTVRGDRIAMVFQDALTALNPVQRVGDQVSEMIRASHRVTRRTAWDRSVELLGEVRIPTPARNARSYPHELSGGMRQRVMIAMGLANHPEILIADEPTTALDVTVQAQVLDILSELQREHRTSVILITHDLGVVAEVADRIAVMYAGRIVETGTRDEVLFHARHPYTLGLLRSIPGLTGEVTGRLPTIPGNALAGVERPPGCAFAPRCASAGERCTAPTALRPRADDGEHLDACVLGRP